MAIIITNNHKFFNNGKNASIIFKDYENSANFDLKDHGDFKLIIANSKVVGINIFNYQNYFDVAEGYHEVNEKQKNYLLKHFGNYLNESDFDEFYKIGEIKEIEQHPNSDKLKVLKVLFTNEEKQIITNVQTVEKGKKYLFATNGSITFTGLRIVDSKVLNVKSEGMIMSYKSLGQQKEEIIDCTNLALNSKYDF